MSIGMSLAGKKVISIFPRWNFLLCATNQLVSHLDKLPIISEGKVTPNILIRTAVGSQRPLFPGYQHIGNMSSAFREMLSNVEIIELFEPEDIFPAYKKAFETGKFKEEIVFLLEDIIHIFIITVERIYAKGIKTRDILSILSAISSLFWT